MTDVRTLPLVLGTAQLGLAYGIANRSGRPDAEAAAAIVREAWEGGIREFDTAQAYGASETVLGEAFRRLGIAGRAEVVTKFDPALDPLDAAAMIGSVERSLERLGVERLEGVMLHREEMLAQWDRGLGTIASRLVSSGKVRRIGVSVYSPDKAIEALGTEGVDMVQVPTSIVDGRFEEAGVFALARERGKRVYVRSVFLQGLLLMNVDELPPALAGARPVIERLEEIARERGLSRRELALAAVKGAAPEARIVFGAETAAQVRENLESWERCPALGPGPWRMELRARVDERLLNPARWPSSATRRG